MKQKTGNRKCIDFYACIEAHHIRQPESHLLLSKREPNTKLPQLEKNDTSESTNQALQNDKMAKLKQKEYADKRYATKPNDIAVGDNVLVKEDKKENKLSFAFKPQTYEVVEKKETW